MKKTDKIFGVLLSIALLFSSCGSDDDNRTEHLLRNAQCKHTHTLGIGDAGATIITPTSTVQLDEMLKSYDYVPPVTNGTMSLTSGTSVKISGLKEGVALENFTITINGSPKTFQKITWEDSELYNDTNLDYFKDVFQRMVQQQALRVMVSYKPTERITDEDDLKIEIVFQGNFIYWK